MARQQQLVVWIYSKSQRSPLLLKLFDNVFGREVEVDFGRQERVMAKQAL